MRGKVQFLVSLTGLVLLQKKRKAPTERKVLVTKKKLLTDSDCFEMQETCTSMMETNAMESTSEPSTSTE